ncbi:uncharacterized protein BDR25DRAFT_315716 [Lindgomyces ingoldianus]|uniref:Uncharacterized protein n=1 Tax=Lindgomyces ingoldianus TaxID=673940 RepID=A0ACB6QQ83_9PLEO|nr:uncharacterized protein BDR25DRAFT_315716 [Lindgomyces ingoldianus]KAF2468728.1 hypothetical protein BDR25DRAFT_315716 [Lindgomyces ingoldianus]
MGWQRTSVTLGFLCISPLAGAFCLGGTFPPFISRGGTCSNDPNDAQNLVLFAVPPPACDNRGTWSMRLTTTNTDGVAGVATARETYTVAVSGVSTTLTFHYDFPVSALKDGAVATFGVDATSGSNGYSAFPSWRQTFISSVFYSTETITIPSVALEMTTTTSTLTVEETSTITPTAFVTSFKGTKTVYMPRATTTKSITITPLPQTVYTQIIIKSTKTVTCIPSKQNSHYRSPRNVLSPRQAPGGDAFYEPPNCGAVTPTTLPTVLLVTSTSTSTATEESLTSTTTTRTITGSVFVSIVSAKATTTITPTRTITKFTCAKRATKTVTKTIKVEQTVYPKGRKTPRCGGWTPWENRPWMKADGCEETKGGK